MRSLYRHMLVAVVAAILATACVTTKEVRGIVASTNALMVAPEMATDAPQDGEEWKDAVQRIDSLIANNPTEETLVATLRVRQALLLTVYSQDALAREAWKQVDSGKLKTDRDRSFYLLSEPLVWWFSFDGTIDNEDWDTVLGSEVPDEGALGTPSEAKLAELNLDNEPTVVQFEMVCDALPVGSDTRLYLEVMRSQIILQVLNDAAVGEEQDREFLASHAVHSVERLIRAFDSEGQKWLRENLSGDQLEGAELLSFLRHLSNARRLINEIAVTATEQELPVSEWRPGWLNESLQTEADTGETSGGECLVTHEWCDSALASWSPNYAP